MEQADTNPSIKGMKTTLIGIVLSIVLVSVKGISGYLGHSYALTANATETGADIFSSALLWFAFVLHQSSRIQDILMVEPA